ncbi:MAG: histidinol-phosphatase HisJ family protein [Bacteroidota bacterium]
MLPDYHTHTVYSDGQDKHKSYLRQAVYSGIDELGFSDHFTILQTNWGVNKKNLPLIKEEMNVLKNQKELPVSVKFGAEIDYIPGKEKEIHSLISTLPLDYVIGSVHFLDNWNFDSDPEGFRHKDIDELYETYFSLLRKAISSDLYDIMGHIDVIKKFAYYPSFSPYEWYKKLIRSMKHKDKVVEINTNGLNKPCKEFYPDKNFVKMCFQANIPVTLGSDAHVSNEVGQHFDQAVEMLRNIGYRKIATFNKRKRRMEML